MTPEERQNHLIEPLLESTRLVREQALTYITTALGLVAGLAWNEAVQGLINYLLPGRGNSLVAKFVYAAAITVAVVLLSSQLKRLFMSRKI